MKITQNILIWKLLVALSKGAGLKSASIECDVDLSTCSRLIDKLEESLGFEVVDSKQRPAQLNENGLYLLPVAKQLIQESEKLDKLIESFTTKSLKIRFSMPVNSPRRSFYDNIRCYEKTDPFITVETFADLDHQALLDGRADVVYLPYRPQCKELICWEVGTQATGLFATKEYLQNFGEPFTPSDLSEHRVILRGGPNYPATDFLYNGKRKEPFVFKKVVHTGDVLSSREALIDGRGISTDLSVSTCLLELKSGLIRPVLKGWHRPPWKMTVAIHKKDVANSRLTSFARWIAKEERKALEVRKKEHAAMIGLDPSTY